jgi:MOSC domain-containing protein YiiM
VERVIAGPAVVAVSCSPRHAVSKTVAPEIVLIAGRGVAGDAHFGTTVQHRYDRRRDATRANLRQVHLIGAELFTELASSGIVVIPGALGENITTRGVDLVALPAGTRLALGTDAVVELTGLREPCVLLEGVHAGVRAATTMPCEGGKALRHGVMAVVRAGGAVRAGDAVSIALPAPPHRDLRLV